MIHLKDIESAAKKASIVLATAFMAAGCSVTHVGGRPVCDDACNARAANDQRTTVLHTLLNHVNRDGVTDKSVLATMVAVYMRGNPDRVADAAFLQSIKDENIREQVAAMVTDQRSRTMDVSVRILAENIGAACREGEALTMNADKNGNFSFTVNADGSTSGGTCMPIWGRTDRLTAPAPAAAGTSPAP